MDSRMQTGHQKDQTTITSLEFSDLPTTHAPKKGEMLETDLVINHTYMMKSPLNPKI